MRLRPLLFVIVLSLALLGVAQSAPAQVAGEKQGVTIVRGSHGYVFRFSKRAAKVYRRIAGRRVTVTCSRVTKSSGNLVVDEGVSSVIGPRAKAVASAGSRAAPTSAPSACGGASGSPSRRSPPTGGPTSTSCSPRPRWTPRSSLAGKGTDAPPPTALVVQRGRGLIVALDGPDASPPAGKLGYWTDGVRSVSAVLTAAGRRLFIDLERDVFRTNVLPYLTNDPD